MSATPATLTIFGAMNGFVMGTLDVTYVGGETVEVIVTEDNSDLLKLARAGCGAEVREGPEVRCSGLVVRTEYFFATRLLKIRIRAVRPVGADVCAHEDVDYQRDLWVCRTCGHRETTPHAKPEGAGQ